MICLIYKRLKKIDYNSGDEDDDDGIDKSPGLAEQEQDTEEEKNDEDQTLAGVTTCSGRVVKQKQDSAYTYTQLDIDLCQEKIQTLKSDSEV
jgi:hypothetical protein